MRVKNMDKKIFVLCIVVLISLSAVSTIYASETLKNYHQEFFSDGQKYKVSFDSPTYKFGSKDPTGEPLILHAHENEDLKGVAVQKENPAENENNKYLNQTGNITLYKCNGYNVAVKQINDFYIEITGANKELITKMVESAKIEEII